MPTHRCLALALSLLVSASALATPEAEKEAARLVFATCVSGLPQARKAEVLIDSIRACGGRSSGSSRMSNNAGF